MNTPMVSPSRSIFGTTFTVLALAGGFGLAVQAFATPTLGSACHMIASATDPVPTGFGSPLELFSSAHEVLIKAFCGSASVTVTVGNGQASQYIYDLGYEWKNGVWQAVRFTGATHTGDWIVGQAQVTLPKTSTELHGKNRVVAYLCEYINGAWKCGCRDTVCASPMWQVQEYHVTAPDTVVSTTQGDGILDVHYPSSYAAPAGTLITLFGSGFARTPSTKVLWNGEVQQEGLASKNGAQITITVPDLPPGKYAVKVQVGGVVSTYGTVIWITNPGSKPSVVTSITPTMGKQGDTFTIHGSGFLAEGNELVTTFGIMSDLPSPDGTTISFTYDPFDGKVHFRTESGGKRVVDQPIGVTVANTSGISNTAQFHLQFY
jgi:hypothetical protein